MSFDPASLSGLSVGNLVDKWATLKPDVAFIIGSQNDEAITFAALQRKCRSFATYLKEQDIPAGSAVAYAQKNGIHSILTILGTLYGGHIATAINLVAGQHTISYVLEHSDTKLIFTDETSDALIEKAMAESGSNVRKVTVDESLFEKIADVSAADDAGVDGLLMYTSGTTGTPKGVVHTHKSLLAGCANTALAHHLSEQDRGLCVLPLYHINAFCVSLMGALVSGGSLVVPPKFSVSNFWSNVRNHDCTWFSVVPTQISYLIHEAETNGHDPSGLDSLRFGRSASAPLAPEVQENFERRFDLPIIETMGLTETAAQILSNPIDGQRKIGSPGIAFGNTVMIADGQSQEVPRGEEGEVLIRGENVMRLYLKNPDATNASLTEDGWLKTGDLGRMDDDGYVFITGRLKELIIKGGENIAPREIDEALYSHPDVVEAAAFARDCTQYGQRVEAGVMIRAGSELSVEHLHKICEDRLGRFKSPDRIHVLPELPKGPSGKIQRLKIAEITHGM